MTRERLRQFDSLVQELVEEQERLARDIVQMLSEALNNEALGFAIVMKGQHLCKTMRGVRNDGKMSVAHFTGVFNLNSDLRKEFYKLIDLNSNG